MNAINNIFNDDEYDNIDVINHTDMVNFIDDFEGTIIDLSFIVFLLIIKLFMIFYKLYSIYDVLLMIKLFMIFYNLYSIYDVL